MMRSRHPLVWVLGFTAFVMNPAFACSSTPDDEFEYGESEMIAAVQGQWRLTFTRPEGASVVTFNIAPGPAPQGGLAAPPGLSSQCGTRTFTRPAAACSPMSTLSIAATVVEAEPPLDTSAGSGWFMSSGTQFKGGGIELNFGSALKLNASIDEKSAVFNSTVVWQGASTPSALERDTVK